MPNYFSQHLLQFMTAVKRFVRSSGNADPLFSYPGWYFHVFGKDSMKLGYIRKVQLFETGFFLQHRIKGVFVV